MRIARTKEDYAVDTVNYLLLFLIALCTIYPFYYVIVASLNLGSDTARGGLYLFPRVFTLNNYLHFFQNESWTNAFLVTMLRTIIGTALSLIFTCLVAYGLSKPFLLFRKTYFMIVIIAMNMSGGLIAYYVILRSYGLLNTFGVYVIPTMLSLFFLLIAVSFFQQIPEDLGESAKMDGAGEVTIFMRIIMPVSKPLLATMCLFIGSGQWNSWMDSAYFVQKNELRTLAYRMIEVINQTMMPASAQASQYTSQLVTTFSVQATAMVISVFPIMCVYPFVQKYFVQGMMIGSVKG